MTPLQGVVVIPAQAGDDNLAGYAARKEAKHDTFG